MRLTIEPFYDMLSRGFAVYRHATHPRGSVLAGQPSRVFVEMFETAKDAQAAHPTAELLKHSTKPFAPGDGSLADYSCLPSCPPNWFDPMDAGESWDEDY